MGRREEDRPARDKEVRRRELFSGISGKCHRECVLGKGGVLCICGPVVRIVISGFYESREQNDRGYVIRGRIISNVRLASL